MAISDYTPEELEALVARQEKIKTYERRYTARVKLERKRYSEGVAAGVISAVTEADIDAELAA